VAEDLFIKDKPDKKYTAEDVTALGVVVKNRVGACVSTSLYRNEYSLTMHCRLKTRYSHYHQKLGPTGHGLVAEGKEGEIKENSDIANAWGTYYNASILLRLLKINRRDYEKTPVVSADARLDGVKPCHKSVRCRSQSDTGRSRCS
jgi:hypothetical protein